jgi:hypothetical protein
MFGSQLTQSVVVMVDYDPQADEYLPIWRAPAACEIKAAYATVVNDVAADTADYFDVALYNGGSAGTALAELAGTIGGTAGWTGLTPKAFTVSQGTLAAGDVVTLHYNEAGAGTFTALAVQLDYVLGVGADA